MTLVEEIGFGFSIVASLITIARTTITFLNHSSISTPIQARNILKRLRRQQAFINSNGIPYSMMEGLVALLLGTTMIAQFAIIVMNKAFLPNIHIVGPLLGAMLLGWYHLTTGLLGAINDVYASSLETLPIRINELEDTLSLYEQPENWIRSSYSEGKWTYTRKTPTLSH